MDIDRQIGARLKQIRDDRGVGQLELATKIGVAQSTVSGYEAGSHIPDKILEGICIALETSPLYLLTGQGDEYASQDEVREDIARYGNQLRESVLLDEIRRLRESRNGSNR